MSEKDEYKRIAELNYTCLTLLGYASAIMYDMMSQITNPPEKTVTSYKWYHDCIDAVVYKNLPPPRIPGR